MTTRDTYNNINILHVKDPATQTATVTSNTIDMQGYRSLTVLVVMGATGDTLSGSIFWTLKLRHSDDDSTYVDCVVGELLNSAATIVVNSNSADQNTFKFGYRGGKRYVKAVITPTGTHTNGTPMGVVAVRSHAGNRPVA